MKTSALPDAPIGMGRVAGGSRRRICRQRFRLSPTPHARFHQGREFDDGIGQVQFAAWPVDLALRDWLFVLLGPAKDILAAALGTPEDFISLCFVGAIGLVDGQRRVRGSLRSNPPGRRAGARQTAVGPTDTGRKWQAAPEGLHRQRGASAYRSTRPQSWSAPLASKRPGLTLS